MAREIDEAWIDEAVARYRDIERLHSEFDRAVEDVRVTVHSPDGLIEVVVSASGTIVDVNVVGSLAGRGNAEVSRSIKAAVNAAQDAARWARQKVRSEVFGAYPELGGTHDHR